MTLTGTTEISRGNRYVNLGTDRDVELNVA